MSDKSGRSARNLLPIYREVDKSMQGALKKFSPTCKKGCSSCCELLVISSSIEADVIAERILSDPRLRADLDTILARLDEQTDFIHRNGAETDSIEVDQHAWWQARHTCALLDPKTRTCRVYEVRPTPCRTYFVVSDPELCERRDPTKTSQIQLGVDGHLTLASWLAQAAEKAGLEPEFGAFPEMLSLALRRRLGTRRETSLHGMSVLNQ